MKISACDYDKLNDMVDLGSDSIILIDHLAGFDCNLHSTVLDVLQQQRYPNEIYMQYILSSQVKKNYPSLNLKFSAELQNSINFTKLANYNTHPKTCYKNFVCSFNGSPHVGRKLLVAILQKFQYFDPNYCSKNFSLTTDMLDGHIQDYSGERDNFYRKFFISDNSEDFFQSIYSFKYERFNHAVNINTLESRLSESFLHVVSETLATSYYPFVTEKFLYSVVIRGLFLAYAQPGWHEHLEKYYGFKLYDKLFDYRFDAIQNPVERLVELMSMISKFSILTTDEWMDLYHLEQDTIEYNYDHYFSGAYLTHLKTYEN
jgi:hypothetical protein